MSQQLRWLAWGQIGEDRDGEPNTWAAEFGQGYLVVHANPAGGECMVYVPHAVSGLGERLEIDREQPS